MPIERLIVIGGGGHAKVVVDAWLVAGRAPGSVAVRDDDPARAGRPLEGIVVEVPAVPPHSGSTVAVGDAVAGFHVAVGSNAARRDLWARAESAGLHPVAVVHPRATVARSAVLEPGCFVAAQAVVGPGAHIGRGAIVNHGAVVDHDCIVGEFAHVAPMALISGGARLGVGSLLGSAACVLSGVIIGERVRVSPGTVVISDLVDGETV